MTRKERQILNELLRLEDAFREIHKQLPSSELFVGMQLQRLEHVAGILGLPWTPFEWSNGDE